MSSLKKDLLELFILDKSQSDFGVEEYNWDVIYPLFVYIPLCCVATVSVHYAQSVIYGRFSVIMGLIILSAWVVLTAPIIFSLCSSVLYRNRENMPTAIDKWVLSFAPLSFIFVGSPTIDE